MPEEHYTRKQIIFHEGDNANTAYIIRNGEVEILKRADHGEIKLATLTDGEVFGEMGLFERDGTRSATARAIQDTVVDTVSHDEFDKLLGQCPPRILPIIQTVLNRLRSSNQRLSQTEQATVILDSDIDKITVSAASEETQFEPVEVMMARLPFMIGGYDQDGKNNKNKHNQLNLLTEGPPLKISRNHCQIEVVDGGLYLTDLGSRFSTIVNGIHIGRGKGKYRVPLQKGANDVQLGGIESPYRITILCE